PDDVIGLIPFQAEILDQAAGFTGEQSFTAAGIAELATRLLN
ncbi:MAG: dehydrogenase maturation factor, partial [Moorella sp. (in: firmicutes)]|nr:dehydrogenase maturation factor [Moorella sp. (in: firmicutes)]MDK2895809.1 dehydrogenase maturation factor [Moorella sp. (in: firmicutes)]